MTAQSSDLITGSDDGPVRYGQDAAAATAGPHDPLAPVPDGVPVEGTPVRAPTIAERRGSPALVAGDGTSSAATPAEPKSEQQPEPLPREAVLTDLLKEVEAAQFPLDLPGAAGLREAREQVLTQIGTRLLPRLRQPTAPAVVVLGGSSGAGKSTLLNSIVGAPVSAAGVLRPTTRRPVLAAHPGDALEGHPLAEVADVVTDDGVPAGLAVLDAPDLDSVHAPNRALAAQLLEAADLWVFVTTAARYGDALPWRTLTDAQDRGITTAVVLNRVPPRVLGQVRGDLLRRMDALGLGSAPLFVIPDVGPHDGPLDAGTVAELDAWLRLVARRQQSAGVVRRTTRGLWTGLREQLFALADGADEQVAAAAELRTAAERALEEPVRELLAALGSGRAAEGAPTARWLSLASAGGPLAPLAGGRARRGWRGRALAARGAAAGELGEEVAAALRILLVDGVRDAAAAVREAWEGAGPAGRTLLRDLDDRRGAAGATGAAHGPAEPADAARRSADATVAAWQDRVLADVTPFAPAVTGALDAEGLAALVQAGAVGVSGAARAVQAVLGKAASALVRAAADDLLARAEEAARAAARPYAEMLDRADAAPGTGLRLRATELRELA
ncbi:hypothetical protein [Georgenia sp. AZ-5]|uniref:hypothetical protein n=1 Tax=Georgenia sp. AZ-5 TaxID=3367526 RepID=UPI003753ED9E